MQQANHLLLETKFIARDDGVLVGYASLWDGPADSVGDIVEAGAFARSLAEHKAAGTMPLMLAEHDGDPIGAWTEIEEDELGLRVYGRLDLRSPGGRAAYADLKSGRRNALSIGYRVREAKTVRLPERGGAYERYLIDLDLIEISVVARPASDRARVLAVKAASTAAQAANGGAAIMHKTEKEPAAAQAATPANDTATPDAQAAEVKAEQGATKLEKMVKQLGDEVKAATDRADRLEAALKRPAATVRDDAAETKARRDAFGAYLRQGAEGLGDSERKSLVSADGARGGFTAPAEFVAEMQRNLVEFSPVRQVATVAQTALGSQIVPTRTGQGTAAWVGETETRSAMQPAFGQVEIMAHEIAAYIDVSNTLLEDSGVDLVSEIATAAAEEAARLEGAAFVSGDGHKKPLGFTDSKSGVATVNAGSTTDVTVDGLITLFHAVPQAYRNRGVWMANGTVIGEMRKLKDTNGDYLWREALAEGNPPTLLGRPIFEANDLGDTTNGELPIAFGDFAAAYRIVDRIGLTVLRDPFSQAADGLTRFHIRRRVGGAVVKAEAIRLQLMSS